MSGDNISFFLRNLTFQEINIPIDRAVLIINMVLLKLPLMPVIVNDKAEIIAGVEVIQSIKSFIENKFEADLSPSILGSTKVFFKDLSGHLQRKIYEYIIHFERVDYKPLLIKQYFGC